ncbi:melanoma-associated antigen B2-like [Myotis daubentonii]|uniref:melanoma-associated antigen B2-like n=1 Tax=Myotis daubentonii TaxID=98922 RepID=UPI002873D9E4|nr:melanoma-associated antigen B2-like [Myotis daubentonii]
MPRGHKSKLRAKEKRRQNKAENQDVKNAEAPAGEEGEAACSSSILGEGPSTSTGAGTLQAPQGAPATTSAAAGASCERSAVKAKCHVRKSKNSSQISTSTEICGLDLISKKVILLVEYLLYQYTVNEPIKKGDMLKIIHKWYRKDFPEILKKLSEHMDMVHGLELKEVKPNGNYYTLVDSQDDTSNGNLGSGFRFPKKGILMPILAVIFFNGNRTSEEEIWEFLNMMSVYDGKSHFIFGEPRKLITQDLVQEGYLLYQPLPNSDPPRYEFLWGPRAYAETTKMKVLEFWAKFNDTVPSAFITQYEEAVKDEEERARAALKAAAPSKDSRCSRDMSKHNPQPE